MEEEPPVLTPGQEAVTPGEYRFVIFWAAGLLLLYVVGGYFGVNLLRGYTAEITKSREAWIAASTTGQNPPPTDPALPSGAKPADVRVGISMNHIGEFALRESAWTADFDITFRWTGNTVNPGETFRIVNGQIVQREKGNSFQRGEERYAEYRVVARMVKPFDASRFPFADEGLVVLVEDGIHRMEALRYVPDHRNTGAGPESIPRNLKLARTLAGVKVRQAGPVQSEPSAPPNAGDAYSQFFFAMLIVPGSIGIYLKLFQALFASVALTLLALYIKPTHVDCRFGLPVGGFFASVANNIFVGTLLPAADRLTLTDMTNTVSLLTIFLVLVQCVISLHIFDTMGRERFSRFFDMVSLTVFVLGYVGLNLALPLAARPQ
jgi:hypothetical protein